MSRIQRQGGFEDKLERGLFAARWLLAPLYVGLIAGLALVVVRFFVELWHLVSGFSLTDTADELTVEILSLIDIALLANLIVIVIFAGYENFVSKMKSSEGNVDRPSWMGHVDFSGLKMKLIGSLVAISVILLLKDFVGQETSHEPGAVTEVTDYKAIAWRIGLHFTFVISGLLFALMDYVGAKRQVLLAQAHDKHPEVQAPDVDDLA